MKKIVDLLLPSINVLTRNSDPLGAVKQTNAGVFSVSYAARSLGNKKYDSMR
ncbi:hypothetical protein MKQ68_16650 [Chitinophaga horti]|uniref:Uncharacterized protein n=1 Tax=Chitinophaga horti TaxID=2920382 RepID=A0ABY6J0F0_9BACT|nr:hypothetical protein [Chitinophaga horti]UYQ91719.1 hypothetical protein MKQ68_16650 [Chitinophaga horti]